MAHVTSMNYSFGDCWLFSIAADFWWGATSNTVESDLRAKFGGTRNEITTIGIQIDDSTVYWLIELIGDRDAGRTSRTRSAFDTERVVCRSWSPPEGTSCTTTLPRARECSRALVSAWKTRNARTERRSPSFQPTFARPLGGPRQLFWIWNETPQKSNRGGELLNAYIATSRSVYLRKRTI